MGCALAPNWESFLVFRLLCGVSASAPIAIVGGVYADVYAGPVERGLAMAVFMAVSFDFPSCSVCFALYGVSKIGWWLGC
jgi:MFS family permease